MNKDGRQELSSQMELYVERPENKGEFPDIQEENIFLRSRERGHEGQADTSLWVTF